MYQRVLNWSGYPEFDQLVQTCTLIWNFFDGSKLAQGSVRTSIQLATLINRLKARPSVASLVQSQIEFRQTDDHDEVVGSVLGFLRSWASFHFPRLLRAVSNIQQDVFSQHGLEAGDYESYAAQVENLYSDAAIVALDEFGIPLETARKLESRIASSGDLDQTILNLKDLDLDSTRLSRFEKLLVTEALQFM